MSWSNGVYTLKGLALMSKMTAGKSMKLTRAVVGTGYVDPDSAAKQTAVSGEKQELLFKTPSYPKTGVCKQGLVLSNDGVTTAYKARQVGIYAYDEDEGEILYFLAQSDSGTDIPAAASVRGYSATWTFYFSYGQADNVEVTVDPSHTVTEDMLKEVRSIAESGVSAEGKGGVVPMTETAELPFAGLSIYGKSNQNGVPSPDAPVDIVSIGEDGSVNVKVYGKNLASKLTATKMLTDEAGTYSLTFSPRTDGGITVNGNTGDAAVSFTLDYKTPPVGDYILSGSTENTRIVALIKYKDTAKPYGYFTSFKGSEVMVPITDEVAGQSIYIEVKANATISNEIMYPLFREASLDNVFEPYTEQVVTLATPNGLRGIPVPSGGNYRDSNGQEWVCDEIDLVRGVYIKRIQSLTFYGDEVLNRDDASTWADGCYTVQISNDPHNVHGELMCSFLPSSSNLDLANDKYPCGIATHGITVLMVRFGADVNTKELAQAAWREAITNGGEIHIILETPVETALTTEEIAACKALHANNPNTTVLSSDGAEMSVVCVNDENEAAFAAIYEESKLKASAASFYAGSVTRHVAKTGSDETGDGSEAKPYLTIQKAVNSLPAVTTGSAKINVHSGAYDEHITFNRFTSGTSIRLVGVAGESVQVKSINLWNNNAVFAVENIEVTGTMEDNYNPSIIINNCRTVELRNVTCVQPVASAIYGAIHCSSTPVVRLFSCTISNKPTAVEVVASTVFMEDGTTGTGNTVAIRCGSGYGRCGGFVQKGGATIEGTETTAYGGQIF